MSEPYPLEPLRVKAQRGTFLPPLQKPAFLASAQMAPRQTRVNIGVVGTATPL
jgi:hypothetical protein